MLVRVPGLTDSPNFLGLREKSAVYKSAAYKSAAYERHLLLVCSVSDAESAVFAFPAYVAASATTGAVMTVVLPMTGLEAVSLSAMTVLAVAQVRIVNLVFSEGLFECVGMNMDRGYVGLCCCGCVFIRHCEEGGELDRTGCWEGQTHDSHGAVLNCGV